MNFDQWWNEDYDDKGNPFERDSFGYWAYAGWCAQQQQKTKEPVSLKVYQGEICYVSQDDDQSFGMWCPVNYDTDHGFPNETKFYKAPPKREWFGLTDNEIAQAVGSQLDEVYLNDFRKVIAKLKEKNT